jgi:hypothetical protein
MYCFKFEYLRLQLRLNIGVKVFFGPVVPMARLFARRFLSGGKLETPWSVRCESGRTGSAGERRAGNRRWARGTGDERSQRRGACRMPAAGATPRRSDANMGFITAADLPALA